jgi:hypothetical protein
MTLIVKTVRVGARALVGGHSLLAAGSRIGPGESTPAVMPLPPFSEWRDNRRIRESAHEPA